MNKVYIHSKKAGNNHYNCKENRKIIGKTWAKVNIYGGHKQLSQCKNNWCHYRKHIYRYINRKHFYRYKKYSLKWGGTKSTQQHGNFSRIHWYLDMFLLNIELQG